MEPRGTIEDSTSPGPSLQRRGREDGDSVNFLEWVSSLRLTKSRGKGKRRSLPFVRGGKGGVEPPPMKPRGAVEDSPSPGPSLQRRGSFCPPMEPRGAIEDSTSPDPSLQRRGREDGDSVNFLEWVSSLRLTKSRGKGKRRSLPFVRGGKGGVEPPPMKPRGAVEDSTSPDPSLQRRGKFLPAHGAPGRYRRLSLP